MGFTQFEREPTHASTISPSPSKKRRLEPTDQEPTTNELWKWTLSRESIAPCFIQDALDMKENSAKEADFYWLGRVPCRTVHIVGLVVGVQVYEKRIRYTLDDGSAVIDCLHKQLPPRSPVKKSQPNNGSSSKPQPTIPSELKPLAHVGDPVSIVGRVIRKYDTREIVVDSIAQCPSSNDEARHWLEVIRLHREHYSLSIPFKIPEHKVTARPSSPVKLLTDAGKSSSIRVSDSTRIVTNTNVTTVLETPSRSTITPRKNVTPSTAQTTCTTHTIIPSSSQASSPAKSSTTQSPQRLRHPSRLHSRDLNGNTFRIYVKHYMDRTSRIKPTPESDYESDNSSVAEYPTTPSKRSSNHITDETPRPRSSGIAASLRTPRPRIPPLSFDGHSPSNSRGPITKNHNVAKGFTLSYLRRVPELADMAKRVVKAVTRRRMREERKKVKEVTTSGKTQRTEKSTHSKLSAQVEEKGELGSRIKRLFQATIVQLLREGSVVLWDGPTHACPTADVPKEQASGLWKANVTSTSADTTMFPTTSVSVVGDDEEEPLLSDPETNEEAYVLLSPAFLADIVEEAIRKLTLAPTPVGGSGKRKGPARYGAATKDGILAYLRNDDRWRYLSEWNIGEALDVLKEEQRAWCVGRGLWELSL